MTRVYKMLGNIQLTLKDMKISRSSVSDHTDLEEIQKELPLVNLNGLKQFENFIQNKENRYKVVSCSIVLLLALKSNCNNFLQIIYYKTIGGSNLKEKIVRILRRTFSNELAAQTSWLGQRNNFKMCNLLLTATIKGELEYIF